MCSFCGDDKSLALHDIIFLHNHISSLGVYTSGHVCGGTVDHLDSG